MERWEIAHHHQDREGTTDLAADYANFIDPYLQTQGTVDAVLIDSGAPTERGGTGIPFDWEAALPLVSRVQRSVPVILAGGLTAENVAHAIRLFGPWGVDVVSGVEREPGKKDEGKLSEFVESVRQAVPAHSAKD